MQIDIKDIEVLGHFFEVAIKRGILHYLIANEYIAATNPNLARWHAHRISKLIFFLQKALNITDPNQEAIVNAGLLSLSKISGLIQSGSIISLV